MGKIHFARFHDDVIKWKHFPCYRPLVRGIHRSPVNSPQKGRWRGALMFSLISRWFETLPRPLWRHNNVYQVCVLRRHHILPLPPHSWLITLFEAKVCIPYHKWPVLSTRLLGDYRWINIILTSDKLFIIRPWHLFHRTRFCLHVHRHTLIV